MPSSMLLASLKASPRMRKAPLAHRPGCACCSAKKGRGASVVVKVATTADKPSAAQDAPSVADEISYLAKRMSDVTTHFPTALNASDFLTRVEVALNAHGFRGDNSISCTNLCRDESTGIFKTMIENIWGNSFNVNGLGACLTCGCLGFKAGFSHSPICSEGKERYVFFSFPHVAICSTGEVGKISRPGRAGPSSACGALIAALGQFQGDASVMEAYAEGAHDAADPEFSILKQRLAQRIKLEGLNVKDMDLVDMTQLAERAISADLEHLISKTVDTTKANYAVVTGVHIHNWGNEGSGEPTLEWIAPSSTYVVNNGKRVNINLQAVPALTPRQLGLLQNNASVSDIAAAFTGATTVVETPMRTKDPKAGPIRGVSA